MIALQQFRRLPKTKITIKTETGSGINPATGMPETTYSTVDEYVYVGDFTAKEVETISILTSLDNSLVETLRKIMSLTEYAPENIITISTVNYKIISKMEKAGIWIYGVEKK